MRRPHLFSFNEHRTEIRIDVPMANKQTNTSCYFFFFISAHIFLVRVYFLAKRIRITSFRLLSNELDLFFITICSTQIVFLSSETLSSGVRKTELQALVDDRIEPESVSCCFAAANTKDSYSGKRSVAFVQHSKALNLIFRMKLHEKSFRFTK